MRYFLDTEFHEYEKEITCYGEVFSDSYSTPTIDLISIGIVAEDGREYYAISKEFDVEAAWDDEWLRENVLKSIYNERGFNSVRGVFNLDYFKAWITENGKSRKQIAEEIKEFVSNGECFCETNDKDACYYDSELMRYRCDMHRLPVSEKPEFYAYYADYDWVVFCWVFGRMIDLPKGFPMYCRDLKQTLDERQAARSSVVNMLSARPEVEVRLELGDHYEIELLKDHPDYPKQTNEHNALDDAKWNKKLYEFLKRF